MEPFHAVLGLAMSDLSIFLVVHMEHIHSSPKPQNFIY